MTNDATDILGPTAQREDDLSRTCAVQTNDGRRYSCSTSAHPVLPSLSPHPPHECSAPRNHVTPRSLTPLCNRLPSWRGLFFSANLFPLLAAISRIESPRNLFSKCVVKQRIPIRDEECRGAEGSRERRPSRTLKRPAFGLDERDENAGAGAVIGLLPTTRSANASHVGERLMREASAFQRITRERCAESCVSPFR